jgi:hypothetical protein
MGEFRRYPERPGALGASGKDVRRIVAQVDVDRLAKERQSREREAKLTKELGHTLIDIGYRVLAAKLHHPDREGLDRGDGAAQPRPHPAEEGYRLRDHGTQPDPDRRPMRDV